MRNNQSLRVCHIIIMEDKLRVNIEKVIRSKDLIQRYVCVKHSGTEIQPHYHIYLDMKYRLPITTIARWFIIRKSFVYGVYSSSDLLQYIFNSLDDEENTLICSRYEKKAL